MLDPWVIPKLVPLMIIVSPATPHKGLTSVMANGIGVDVGEGALEQPTKNRKVSIPIKRYFFI